MFFKATRYTTKRIPKKHLAQNVPNASKFFNLCFLGSKFRPQIKPMQIMSCNKFPGFNLTAGDLNLTILVEVFTNHISAENTYFTNYLEWTEHKIMGFKPANRYRIIRQSLLFMISIIIHFFVNQKLCKHYVYGAEHNKLQSKTLTIQTFIYYWIYSGVRKVFWKKKFHYTCNIKMSPFEGLL